MVHTTEIKIDIELKLNNLPHVSLGIIFLQGVESVCNQKMFKNSFKSLKIARSIFNI